MSKLFQLFRSYSRLGVVAVIAVALMAALLLLSPMQAQVALYKVALVFAAGYIGYWFDVALFPYARPNGFLAREWQDEKGFRTHAPDHAVVDGYQQVFAAAMLRRAVVIGCCMLAVGLGL